MDVVETRSPVPRVGVYVDAFNVFYGARSICGRGVPGWRWLDLPTLASSLINPGLWIDSAVVRAVYCTAERTRPDSPSSLEDQRTYIRALQASCPGLEVLLGLYAPRTKVGVLVDDSETRVRSPGRGEWPNWFPGREVPGIAGPAGPRELLVKITTFEEKGSDVNVAAALLQDVLQARVDAAIVFSNDSDLALPLKIAREHVPVGTVNPTRRPLARGLRGLRDDGVGRHWWRNLKAPDYFDHQMTDPAGGVSKPVGW